MISRLSFALAGILLLSLPLAGCAKTGEGSYHASVATILTGLKTGKFIINDDAGTPENSDTPRAASGSGKIKNYNLDTAYFYGISGTSARPNLEYFIEGIDGNFIIVRIKNDTDINCTAHIENYFYPAQNEKCDFKYLDDTNRYKDTAVTVPKKKTITARIPIPNIPGPLSYCGTPYDESAR